MAKTYKSFNTVNQEIPDWYLQVLQYQLKDDPMANGTYKRTEEQKKMTGDQGQRKVITEPTVVAPDESRAASAYTWLREMGMDPDDPKYLNIGNHFDRYMEVHDLYQNWKKAQEAKEAGPAQVTATAPAQQQAAPQTTAQAVQQAAQKASANYNNAANVQARQGTSQAAQAMQRTQEAAADYARQLDSQAGNGNGSGTPGQRDAGALNYEKPENQGMYAGVSDATRAQLEKYQQGYQQGDIVTQAQQALADIQNAKPQGYESKYGEQLDQLLQQITNPEKFNYEFNGDNLFKAYSDLYEQKAQQANLNAQGAAAALTGGYGNSYAESVGQEAYQQQMMELLDKGLEMRNTAYQAYQDELANRLNQYGVLNAAEQAEYGRYRDTLSDWQREEELAYNREFNERQLDYNQYMDQLNYYTGLAQIENQAWASEEQRQEAIRQFTLNYNETLRQNDIANSQWERQFSETQRQNDIANAQWLDQYNEMVRQNDIQNAQWQDQFNWQVDTNQRDFEENVRQYEQSFAEQARQFDLNLQLGYDTLESNENIAAGHDAASIASATIGANASIQAAQMTSDYHDKLIDLQQQELDWKKMEAERDRAKTEGDAKKADAISMLMATIKEGRWPTAATIKAAGYTEKDIEAYLGFKRGEEPKTGAGAGPGTAKKRVIVRGDDGQFWTQNESGRWVPTKQQAGDVIDTWVYSVPKETIKAPASGAGVK